MGLALILLALSRPGSADVFVTRDGGKSWMPAGLQGKGIDELVADPRDPAVVYALVGKDPINRTELHRTTDGGRTWTKLEPGVALHCVCIAPLDSKMIWVGGADGTFAKSTDGGATWEKGALGAAAAPQGRAMNVRGMVVCGKKLFATGGQGTGFLAWSEDDGKIWTRVNRRLGYAWACAAAGNTVLVGGDSGLLVSIDGGATFAAKGGLDPQPGVGGRFSMSSDGKTMAFSFRGTTARSDDGGATWKRLKSPAADAFIHSLAWSGGHTVATLAHGVWEKSRFRPSGAYSLHATDDGATWSQFQGQIPGAPVVVVGSADGSALWLGTR